MRVHQIMGLGLLLTSTTTAFMVPSHGIQPRAIKTSFSTQVRTNIKARW